MLENEALYLQAMAKSACLLELNCCCRSRVEVRVLVDMKQRELIDAVVSQAGKPERR